MEIKEEITLGLVISVPGWTYWEISENFAVAEDVINGVKHFFNGASPR